MKKFGLRTAAALSLVGALVIVDLATYLSIRDVDAAFRESRSAKHAKFEDRFGNVIRKSFDEDWNFYDVRRLHEIPSFLVESILGEEDQNYFDHEGVDWKARFSALLTNLTHGRVVRGASSITEQVVRFYQPRTRNLWSKWLEGIEASQLESKESKIDILETYLNQIPFARNRRGVSQAAEFFFDRDLSTLNEKEMLALAVMIKRPARYASLSRPDRQDAIERLGSDANALARRLLKSQKISEGDLQVVISTPLIVSKKNLQNQLDDLNADDFLRYVESQNTQTTESEKVIQTTLQPVFQSHANEWLQQFLKRPDLYKVRNGAVIALDHRTNEILVWAVGNSPDSKAAAYDSVLVPRQPGSSLKPFLYATAFEKGWDPFSLILDEPFSTAVGVGQHGFKNYSRLYYGWIPLREALGNSLNVPAVKLANQVGVGTLLQKLRDVGISSLRLSASEYGEGLALGNGEVSLLEMTRAYAVLARGGIYKPLRVTPAPTSIDEHRVFSDEAATLVSDVLSDASARNKEFAQASSMDFPLQTAVKTGTSTDYRDSWAFAYNYRYVVGVWMGNLDSSSTEGLSGSFGPMMLARSVMAKMLEGETTEPLRLSSNLQRLNLCRIENSYIEVEAGTPTCGSRAELMMPGHQLNSSTVIGEGQPNEFQIVRPSENLRMAVDPRVSADLQKYTFSVAGLPEGQRVEWVLNKKTLGLTETPEMNWKIQKGPQTLEAKLIDRKSGAVTASTGERQFFVR